MRVASDDRRRRLALICVPFDLGARGVGVGRGPLELLGEGALADRFRDAGYDLDVAELLDPPQGPDAERVFEIGRSLGKRVSAARDSGRLPLILGGNCSVCLGALAGTGATRLGIVWVDSHADFLSPDTSGSASLDGIDLAIATGACGRLLARSIPEFRPVAERDTILVGVRNIGPGELGRLRDSEVTVIAGGGGPGSVALDELERALATMASRLDAVYLHVDLDAIDAGLGRANEHASGGGLGIEDIQAVTAAVAQRVPIAAVAFTAYDPDADPDGRFGDTAIEAIQVATNAILGATRTGRRAGSSTARST